jgi:hypothetical protein
MADEVKENNKQLVCEIKIDAEMMRKIIDEKMTQIELDIQEIRAKAIDEFAENLKRKILEEIYDVSDRQKNYEVGSDMSMTCSHIMGTLRDVYHRIVDEIAEQLKGGAV